ncbi:MAG: hypothetical protein ABI333_27855 [bacterium]
MPDTTLTVLLGGGQGSPLEHRPSGGPISSSTVLPDGATLGD